MDNQYGRCVCQQEQLGSSNSAKIIFGVSFYFIIPVIKPSRHYGPCWLSTISSQMRTHGITLLIFFNTIA